VCCCGVCHDCIFCCTHCLLRQLLLDAGLLTQQLLEVLCQ
jgi:hypothetical protein